MTFTLVIGLALPRAADALLPEPAPRALVDAIEPGGIRADVSLQRAGMVAPRSSVSVAIVGRLPVDLTRVADGSATDGAIDQARANLRKDARAAATRDGHPDDTLAHVLHEAEAQVSDEGTNLLRREPANAS